MQTTESAWPQAEASAEVLPEQEDVGIEVQSLYASAAWRTGKRDDYAPPIFDTIARHPHCVEYDVEIRALENTDAVLSYVRGKVQRFDPGNIVIAFAALSKMGNSRGLQSYAHNIGFMELEERVRTCIPRLEPRGLSMVAYALARLQWRDEDLVISIVSTTTKRILDFGSTDLAKIAWSLAKLAVVDNAWNLWGLLAKEATRKCCDGSFIDISMIAWAFASINFADRALFGQLATATMQRRAELPPQSIANLAWAFAKARVQNEAFFEVLADRSLECVGEFDRQGVSNTLWAFATAGVIREDLFSALSAHAIETGLLRKMSPQMVSNIAWAFARAGIAEVPLFEAVAIYIRENTQRLDNQNISNCAWAFSIVHLPNKEAFDILTECAVGRLSKFRNTELSGLLGAFTRAKAVGSTIFEEAADVLLSRADQLDSQGVSNTIWIFATVSHLQGKLVSGTRELIDKLLANLLELRVRLDSEGAAMTIWALWRLGRFHDAWVLYTRLLSDGRHPAMGKSWKQNSTDGRQQYWQILLLESERRGDVVKQVYLWKQMAADSFARSLRSAFLNCAVIALVRNGDNEEAAALIAQLVRTRLDTKVTQCLADQLSLGPLEQFSPAETIDNALRRRPSQASRYEDIRHREIGLLDLVLSIARAGDAHSVHAAIESVGLRESWLKISGGEKACILDNALHRFRPAVSLEYGGYVGYTTSRMANQVRAWGGKVVSLEMDPVNVAIARNIIEFAGLSRVASVQVGHSDDSTDLVLDTYGEESVGLVFMDQRGTKFHTDLQRLEKLNLLANPCIVIADNVLNPGAPLYIWRVCSMTHYTTDIVSLRKFGMADVRDWVTVSVVRRSESYAQDTEMVPKLISLAKGADRFRNRARTMPRNSLNDPAEVLSASFEEEFARLGVIPSMAVLSAQSDAYCVSSWLVRLLPGEILPEFKISSLNLSENGNHFVWRSILADPRPLNDPMPA